MGGVWDLQPVDIAAATGGFHSLSEIGEGGFGKVYRAVLHQRPVAIKVMAAGGLQGSAEFENEVSLLSRLSHGHLVRLLGVVRSADPPLRCLVYELMPGGSVEQQLDSKAGRCVLPWWLRVRIAAQIAAAVAYLHTLPSGPILHRDIKPANFFLDGRLHAKLGDVGLATTAAAAAAASSSSRTGGGEREIVGDYAYLPPEYRASGQLSLKADVYALGVSLLQLATGRVQRQHEMLAAAKQAAAAGDAAALLDPKAGAWDRATGERLIHLGLWCCSDAPDARPTAQLLAQELAKLWLAVDQTMRGTQSQHQQQQPGSAVSRADGPQQQSQQQQQAGGSFWRFLTNSSLGR